RLVSHLGNFSDFWYARKAASRRAVGRVAKRRRRGERAAQQGPAETLTSLERQIAEAEQEKLSLERRMADAFERRDPREGRRAARQLQQLKAKLEGLYEKWMDQNP
ncbi:MAG TPA: ABC transporter C-terminal domain-containing protein, partial [Phycisphaerae bacterium]|nr:ABC transporter C-terminal domain-containing protein [Phycisphaerae bacterium]